MAEKRSQINNSVGEGSVPSADPEEVWYDEYDLAGSTLPLKKVELSVPEEFQQLCAEEKLREERSQLLPSRFSF